MRCLAIAEAAEERGHDVVFVSAIGPIGWLEKRIQSSGFHVVSCEPDSLDSSVIASLYPDWVVVDSYEVPAASITELNEQIPCLVLVDGDHRDMEATLYVDPNLDSEDRDWPRAVRARLLAGARYAIVRREVLAERRADPWKFRTIRPRIVAFMGGTDPNGAIVRVAEGLVDEITDAHVVLVTAEQLLSDVSPVVDRNPNFEVVAATAALPHLLAQADIVISAAGTSAWDLCSLGVPSVLVAVVDNQVAGLEAALAHGLAVGFDAHRDVQMIVGQVASELQQLLHDESLRKSMSDRSLATFDGMGTNRIVTAMEKTCGFPDRHD